METDSKFVITIRRQLGSGGATIGKALADKLGIFYADSFLITEAAKKLRINENELKSREEKALFWRRFLETYSSSYESYLPNQIGPVDRDIFDAQTEIILEIAKEKSSVIIGRCSNFILKDFPNHYSIFLHADDKFRISRLMEVYKVTEDEARKMMIHNDKERAQYNRKYTGEDWTDIRQYDLSIDTSKLGIDNTVELILFYLAKKGIKPV